jgi:hypothetical protein
VGQVRASAVPQLEQNFRPARLSVPQFGQVISASADEPIRVGF